MKINLFIKSGFNKNIDLAYYQHTAITYYTILENTFYIVMNLC